MNLWYNWILFDLFLVILLIFYVLGHSAGWLLPLIPPFGSRFRANCHGMFWKQFLVYSFTLWVLIFDSDKELIFPAGFVVIMLIVSSCQSTRFMIGNSQVVSPFMYISKHPLSVWFDADAFYRSRLRVIRLLFCLFSFKFSVLFL